MVNRLPKTGVKPQIYLTFSSFRTILNGTRLSCGMFELGNLYFPANLELDEEGYVAFGDVKFLGREVLASYENQIPRTTSSLTCLWRLFSFVHQSVCVNLNANLCRRGMQKPVRTPKKIMTYCRSPGIQQFASWLYVIGNVGVKSRTRNCCCEGSQGMPSSPPLCNGGQIT